MTDHLKETAAEVAALIPRYSWEIMDEGQRDDLIVRVVEPRYMAETKDGVNLGPSWWAEVLGATAESIRSRVKRLKQSQTPDDSERSRALSESRVRHTRSGLTQADDEQLDQIVRSLPPERRDAIGRAVQRDGAQEAVDSSLDVQVARMVTQASRVNLLLREGRRFSNLDAAKSNRLREDLDQVVTVVERVRDELRENSKVRRIA